MHLPLSLRAPPGEADVVSVTVYDLVSSRGRETIELYPTREEAEAGSAPGAVVRVQVDTGTLN